MRYNQINRYGKKMILEQDLPPLEDAPEGDVPPPAGDVPPPAGDAPSAGDAPVGDVPPPAGDIPPSPDQLPEPMGDESLDTMGEETDVEEMDITDLVNMTKSIKKDIETNKTDNSSVINKMDDVFTKLNDLEAKLAQMDDLINRIDQLGYKIEQVKEPTPEEKLEMRSLDSYPFNEKPREFFNRKQGEMRSSGKNEYILTKDDVVNYSQDTIKDTFNPEEEDNL